MAHLKSFRYILLFGWALSLGACQTPTFKPLPTVTLLHIGLSPTLDWIRPHMNLCTQPQAGLGLLVDPLPAASMDPSQADILFRWGAPAELKGQADVIGWDELVVIVHPLNPIQQLTLADLQAIYKGKQPSWKKLNAPDPTVTGEIAAWGYSDGDDIQQIWQTLLASPANPANLTGLAPNPTAMRQIIAGQVQAIGYLPSHWMDRSVRAVPLVGIPADMLRLPILAIFQSEPKGAQRSWLLCLQESIKP